MSGIGVSHRIAGPVAQILLSRSPHNYFDVTMIARIAELVELFDRTSGIRVSLLSSSQKHFCAGADFSAGARPDPKPIYEAAARLMTRRKPLIAAINGGAVGGGLGLALVADLRVGADNCWLQANFVKIGLSPGFGLSYTLPHIVGPQRARDLFLTCRRVDAPDALSIGLLDRVAPADRLEEASMSVALDMAASAPGAVHATRRLLVPFDESEFTAAIEEELALQRHLFSSPNFDEGVAAARERRTPTFEDYPEEQA